MNKKPRILLVGPSHPFRGGIAHYTTLLYRALRQRFDTRFLSFQRQYPKILFPGVTDRDRSEVSIREEGAENVLDTLEPWTWIRAGFIARSYDAIVLPWWVVFWTPYYLLLLLAASRKAKVIFLCHNVVEHEGSRAKVALSRMALGRGDAFVVHSKEEETHLRALLGPDVIVSVCPHPSYDVFDLGKYDSASARAKLGLSPESYVVLFFGFIRPYKGLDVLLDAFAQHARHDESATLLVVGESWEKDDAMPERLRLLGIADRTMRVDAYVPNEDVEPYFKAADVVALPYLSGTGSGIAQIAMSMGKPVVATRIGAFDDVVEDGVTGLLVPRGDVEALARAIGELGDRNRRERMSREVEAHKGRFAWVTMVDTLEGLIEKIRA